MQGINKIPLPTLPLPLKIFHSLVILAGLALFIGTWMVVLDQVYLLEPTEILGVQLGVLASSNEMAFHQIFLMHSLGMVFILISCYRLFHLSSLRDRTKRFVFFFALVLTAVDLSGWGYAPSCSSTNLYVGLASAIAAVPLVILAMVPLFQMWFFKRWKPESRKSVVVVGGGFAGLYTALGLNRVLGYHPSLRITVIDKKNYFLFPPLLPSAATGTIETLQVTYPFRRIFETTNIEFRKVEVTSIAPAARRVTGLIETDVDPETGRTSMLEACFEYDYLVLCPGSVVQTFDTPGAEEHAFFMRELNDAVRLRNHVIDCFERAAVVSDAELKRELLTFVVAGGGPTGIETATEIYDLIHHILLKRYAEIDRALPSVRIVQSGPHILPGWHPSIVRIAEQKLASMKIPIVFETKVVEVSARAIALKNGDRISTRTLIWCAGVKPSPLLGLSGLSADKSGRLPVGEDLRSVEDDRIFIVGDAASCTDPRTGKTLPPLGQVAFQQGSRTARNLVRLLSGKQPLPFRYFDFGGLVSVGEHFAAVNLLGVRLSGFIGWFVWRTLYLVKLVGASNKLRVVIDWTLDLLIERSFSQIQDDTRPARLVSARNTKNS